MRWLDYLKTMAGELVLLFLSVWPLCMVSFNAFFVEESSLTTAASAGMVAVFLVVAAFVTYSRKTRLVGVVVYLVVTAVLVGVCLSISTSEEGAYADALGNYLYFGLLVSILPALGFALSRTRAGSALWFTAVALTCSVVQAFYLSNELVLSMVSLFASLALLIYGNFNRTLRTADMVKKPQRLTNFLASLAPVLGAGALALVVWFVVIAPLNPGVAKITLITDYRQLPIVEVKGVVNEKPDFNTDMKTDVLTDGTYYTTDDLYVEPEAETVLESKSILVQQPADQDDNSQTDQGGGNSGGKHSTLDPNDSNAVFDPISYSDPSVWGFVVLAILLLIIAAIVAFFLIRRRRRMKRLQAMLNQDPKSQVTSIYLFLMGNLAKLGFTPPSGTSLNKFWGNSVHRMSILSDNTRVTFTTLTQTYESCVYGNKMPTEEEILPFVAYYLSFWKAARAHLGNFRYFFKSFRLG